VIKTAEENISKYNEGGKRLLTKLFKELQNLCCVPNISGV
jgi:hypothetical protein